MGLTLALAETAVNFRLKGGEKSEGSTDHG